PDLTVTVRRRPAEDGATVRTATVAGRHGPWAYQPSGGVRRSRAGKAYPLYLSHAEGCRVRDLEGNEWIDYVVGWGSALLGYGHPAVAGAVAAHAGGAILSLPHALEARVMEALAEAIPCAEMVLLGKNGSDACTAAIRAARLHTGRRKVLFSGYHGWQEWSA